MKAIFRRDWLMFTHPFYLLALVAVIMICLVTAFQANAEENVPQDLVLMGLMLCLMSSVFPQAILLEDERNGWLRFSVTMPVKRSDYVSEKYLLTLGFILLFALLNSIGIIILMVQTTGFDIKEYLFLLLATTSGGLLMMSIDLPMLFRFGTGKGLALFVVLFVFIFLSGFCLFAYLSYDADGRSFLQWVQTSDHFLLALLLLAVLAVIYSVSWLLSIRLYRKREF